MQWPCNLMEMESTTLGNGSPGSVFASRAASRSVAAAPLHSLCRRMQCSTVEHANTGAEQDADSCSLQLVCLCRQTLTHNTHAATTQPGPHFTHSHLLTLTHSRHLTHTHAQNTLASLDELKEGRCSGGEERDAAIN